MKKLFLLIFVLFASSVYAETKIIDCNVNNVVEFGFSDEFINKLKAEHGEDDFYVIADDMMNIGYNLSEYVKKHNIKMTHIIFSEVDTVIFKNDKKEVKVPTKGNDWTVWYCGKNKQPEKHPLGDGVIEKTQEYFNIKE